MFSPETSLTFLSVVTIFSLGEYVIRKRAGRSYDKGAVLSSLAIAIGQGASRIPTTAILSVLLIGGYELAPLKLDTSEWWAWVIGFFAVEFFYYWQHRFSHTIRWVWATHAVHHSPNEFTFPVAFRLGWTGALSASWLVIVPLAFLGVPPLMIAVLYTINLQYQFFLHTETIGKLGPLEWIFNTPSHHRVHHGSNEEYLDKNYGGVLIIFDRLFGTFTEENETIPVKYGLTDPITSKNPFVIVFREWGRMLKDAKSAPSLGDALHALFKKPGSPARQQPMQSEGQVSLAE